MPEGVHNPRWHREAENYLLRQTATLPWSERQIVTGLAANQKWTDGLLQAMLEAADNYIGETPEAVGVMLTGLVALSIAWAAGEMVKEGQKDGTGQVGK